MYRIYLDSAATTKPKQEVIDAMMPYLTDKWHNPSSLYSDGIDVKNDIEAARKTIADFISAEPEEIYFTSGASESNSWAVRGFCDYYIGETKYKPQIITTRLEHKSIMDIVNSGVLHADICFCRNDEYGFVDYESLSNLLKCYEHEPVLVTVHFANNEIGSIQDIKAVSNLVHKYGGILHVDATQALGKIPINVEEMGIDMMSASGHKISALKGIGLLYVKKDIKILPLIYGSQQNHKRGGTENVAGIIGFAKAVELCNLNTEKYEFSCILRDAVIETLQDKFGCKLNGHDKYRLPNNINVTFSQNITGESLLYTLDFSGISISTGSACNSHSYEPSHVLKAIGLSDDEAMRTIRITLPDIDDYTVNEWNEMVDTLIKELDRAIKVIEVTEV